MITVEHQQQTVAKVLGKIKQYIDNDAIVAGGAPRNWLQNKPARDIDLYLRSFCNTTTKRLAQLNNALGFKVEPISRTSNENFVDYGLSIGIVSILSFMVDGVEFQLIYIKTTTDDFKNTVINHIDTGINRVGYDGYYGTFYLGGYIKTQEYINDVSNNTITVYKDTMSPDQLKHCLTHHLPKMISYFPEHKLVIL